MLISSSAASTSTTFRLNHSSRISLILIRYLFILLCLNNIFSTKFLCKSEIVHYNIPDPECSGPFGSCTQEDKDRLGYNAIKKLHEKMDEDSDGQVEIQETKEFMKEELLYKNGAYNDRQVKFHGNDMLITVDEMWKAWQHSQVYNWTTDDVIVWLKEQVKLPQYGDYFRRNLIDGQFLPRLALNDNNYYSNIMQIKDPRHRRLLMIKATDLILFGQQQKPHNLVKDILMISALTMSIFVCIYLYSKHRQSLDQIKKMLIEFEKLTTNDDGNTLLNQLRNNINTTSNSNNHLNMEKTSDENFKCSSIFGFKRKPTLLDNDFKLISNQIERTPSSLFFHQKENQIIIEKNLNLIKELNLAKEEADYLRKARENADGQLVQLKLAEQELEKVRAALKQTEARLEIVKYQPPATLITLLNRTYESEKELLDYKFKLIDKEKEACVDSLNKVCKRQSGLMGALKIAHSSTLEEIQHKLELLKRELNKLKSEKYELNKRWNNIFDLCNRTESNQNQNNTSDNASQDLPIISLENGLFLPHKLWHHQSSISSNSVATTNNNNNSNINNKNNCSNSSNNSLSFNYSSIKQLIQASSSCNLKAKSYSIDNYNLTNNYHNSYINNSASNFNCQISNNNNNNNNNNNSKFIKTSCSTACSTVYLNGRDDLCEKKIASNGYLHHIHEAPASSSTSSLANGLLKTLTNNSINANVVSTPTSVISSQNCASSSSKLINSNNSSSISNILQTNKITNSHQNLLSFDQTVDFSLNTSEDSNNNTTIVNLNDENVKLVYKDQLYKSNNSLNKTLVFTQTPCVAPKSLNNSCSLSTNLTNSLNAINNANTSATPNQIPITSSTTATSILPTTNPTATTTTTTTVTQKIARDTLIHKNDVFQFDDVDSVQTNDLFFKNTPQSSFESDDTYKSSSLKAGTHYPLLTTKTNNNNNITNNGNKHITEKHSSKNTRNVKSSSLKKKEKNGGAKFLRPLSISSTSSNKLKKSVTTNAIENGDSSVSLERSNTFKRHLSSLRRLLNSSKQNINNSQNIIKSSSDNEIKPELQKSASSIPIISSNNLVNKQLTISVNPNSLNSLITDNNNNNKNINVLPKPTNSNDLTQNFLNSSNNKASLDIISIPFNSSSNTSFTITNKIKSESADPVPTYNADNDKKSKIFKFKFSKTKKSKSSNSNNS